MYVSTHEWKFFKNEQSFRDERIRNVNNNSIPCNVIKQFILNSFDSFPNMSIKARL